MKKLLKISLCTAMLVGFLIICFPALAQTDSTGTGGTTSSGSGIWDWITRNIPIVIGAILAIYEAIVRFVPTVKDWSIVNKIIAALQFLMDKVFPNNAKSATTGAVTGVHENSVIKTTAPTNNKT